MVLIISFGATGTAFAQSQGESGDTAERPSYAAMADLLEDEQSRQRLIDELRRLATEPEAGEAPPAPAAEAAEPAAGQPSLPRRIASTTQAFAEELGERLGAATAAITALTSADAADRDVDFAAVASVATRLALVVVATVVLFFVLRALARPLFARCGRWAARDGGRSMLRRLAAVTTCLLVDLAAVALAGVGGYALALFVLGERGSLDAASSLFINAFVLIEAFKALLRMIFAARYDSLRLFPVSAHAAGYWNSWLARLSGFIGYGLLVVVPIVTANVSAALGQLVSLAVMVIAFVYALVVILKNRTWVRERLEARANQALMGVTGVAQRLLARTWHVLAIAYFAVLLVVSQLRPADALPFMMRATLETLVAVAVGLLVSRALTQRSRRRIELSADLHRRLPMLEKRLNAYVPNALKVARAVILVAVVLVVLNAWEVFDLAAWLASEAGMGLVMMFVRVLLILAIAGLLWMAVASGIEHRLSPETGSGEPSAREKTLLTLFGNALAIVFITITAMIMLSQIGINIGPLIAGAGVLGLAIGFGAQKLVQDVITGVFIQIENAMNTGDVVTVAGVSGTVERLTVRSAGIRDLSGTYHVIPFSSVDTVANYMRGYAYHVGEYGIAYREDVDEAVEHLEAAFEELRADPAWAKEILDDLEVSGVTALADSSVNIRVRIMTTPGNQWAVGRAYNRVVKQHFDRAGIEIPFPHLTLYFGQDKDGSAPPANVAVAQGGPGYDELMTAAERGREPQAGDDDAAAAKTPPPKQQDMPQGEG